MTEVNTHGIKMTFGKHKGTLITRIPLGYLRWMVNENAPMADMAKAELERRGNTDFPKVEVSGHAIDRASLRVQKVWRKTMLDDEGLHAWLQRMTLEALERGTQIKKEKYKYQNMSLVIFKGEEYPVLKSVMMTNTPNKGDTQ